MVTIDRRLSLAFVIALVLLAGTPADALAHGVAQGDKGYIQAIFGVHLIPFAYLGTHRCRGAGARERGLGGVKQEIGGSAPPARVARGSAVLEKLDGRWTIVHYHVSH
jgi:hypothetical protein